MPLNVPAMARLTRSEAAPETPTPASSNSTGIEAALGSIRSRTVPARALKPVKLPSPAMDTIHADGQETERRQREQMLKKHEPRVSMGSDADIEEDRLGYDEHSPMHGSSARRARVNDDDATSDQSAVLHLQRDPRQRTRRVSDDAGDDENVWESRQQARNSARPALQVQHAQGGDYSYHSEFSVLQKGFAEHMGEVQAKGHVSPPILSNVRPPLGELHATTSASPTHTTAKQQSETYALSAVGQSYEAPRVPQHSRAEATFRAQANAATPAAKRNARMVPPSTIKPAMRIVSDPSPAQTAPAEQSRRVTSPPPTQRHAHILSPLPSTQRESEVQPHTPPRSRHRSPMQRRHQPLVDDLPVADLTGCTEQLFSPEQARRVQNVERVKSIRTEDTRLSQVLQQLEAQINGLSEETEDGLDRLQDKLETDSGFGGETPEPEEAQPRYFDRRTNEHYTRMEAADVIAGTRQHMERLARHVQSHVHLLGDDIRQRKVHNEDFEARIMKTLEAVTAEFAALKKLIVHMMEILQTPLASASLPSRPILVKARSEPMVNAGRAAADHPRCASPTLDLQREIARGQRIASVDVGGCGHQCDDCTRKVQAARDEQERAKTLLTEETAPHAAVPILLHLARLEEERKEKMDIYVQLCRKYQQCHPSASAQPRQNLALEKQRRLLELERLADEIAEGYEQLHYTEHPGKKPIATRHQQRRTALLG